LLKVERNKIYKQNVLLDVDSITTSLVRDNTASEQLEIFNLQERSQKEKSKLRTHLLQLSLNRKPSRYLPYKWCG